MKFIVLHRDKLDEAAYLFCLAEAEKLSKANTFYALPWYLDIVAKGKWSVAVWQNEVGKYVAIAPFAHQRKFGIINEVYMPMLCQQLGIFCSNEVNGSELVFELLSYFESHFLRVGYAFNASNELHLPKEYGNWKLISRVNQEVDCSGTPEEIFLNFNATKRKHVKRGAKVKQYKKDDIFQLIQDFAHSETGKRLSISAKEITVASQIVTALKERQMLIPHLVYQEGSNQLLLALTMARHGNRIISLFGGPSRLGKDLYVQDYALHQSIELIAGLPNAVLDFEGSNILGVQQFNASFGAKIVPYTFVSWQKWG